MPPPQVLRLIAGDRSPIGGPDYPPAGGYGRSRRSGLTGFWVNRPTLPLPGFLSVFLLNPLVSVAIGCYDANICSTHRYGQLK